MVMDEYSRSLPYWFRAGLADLYSTLKPDENQIKLGIPPVRDYRSRGIADLDLSLMFGIDRAGLLAARSSQGADLHADTEATSTVFGAANAAHTTALTQTQSAMAQDFGGGVRMLTHIIMFQPEYRPKFGEFVSTPGSGQPTGAVFNKVYGRSPGQICLTLLLSCVLQPAPDSPKHRLSPATPTKPDNPSVKAESPGWPGVRVE